MPGLSTRHRESGPHPVGKRRFHRGRTGIAATRGAVLVMVVALTCTGCGAETGNGTGLGGNAPEIGSSLASGLVLLNVAGASYRPGDIVRIDAQVARIPKGGVVLFDWRQRRRFRAAMRMRRALSLMNPSASFWLYAPRSSSKVATLASNRLSVSEDRPTTLTFPL